MAKFRLNLPPEHATALKIAGIYCLAGALWILLSGWLLGLLATSLPKAVEWQIVKGLFFVLATAILLYILIFRMVRSIRRAESARTNSQAAAAALQSQITERARVHEELLEAKLAAEAANQAKTAFVAKTSHELRTPLTSIVGYTDLLLDSNAHLADRAGYLRLVGQSASHLLRLVDDLLDLSRIEAGKLCLAPAPTALREILREIDAISRPAAQAKGLAFTISCAADVPASISTDPARLRQILLNLVGNALKFTPSGSITLTATLAQPDTVRLSVHDTGVGMSPVTCEKIFEPFYQAENPASPKTPGAGLGLAIAQQLARMLGSGITVESTLGQGAAFTFDLPIQDADAPGSSASEPAATTPAPPPASPAPLENRKSKAENSASPARTLPQIAGRILLAEDDSNIRRLVTIYLQTAGASVTAVDNGRIACAAALEALHAGQPFDLIIMDMQMPEADGLTSATLLRARGCATPILALTAHLTDREQQLWHAAGGNDIVPKPINRQTFIQVLEHYLGTNIPHAALSGNN